MRPPVPQPSSVTPMAVPAQIGADFSCSGCKSARSANGRTTIRAYVSYPSKTHPRKLALSTRQCIGVRSLYQACDADRTEATEFIKSSRVRSELNCFSELIALQNALTSIVERAYSAKRRFDPAPRLWEGHTTRR